MPIIVELIREGRAVLQTYSDPVSEADMAGLRDKMELEILPNATSPIPIIADFRQISNVPKTLLWNGRHWLKKAHPNTGTVIGVVKAGFGFIPALAGVFSRFQFRTQEMFVVTDSLEKALVKLNQLLDQNKPTDEPTRETEA